MNSRLDSRMSWGKISIIGYVLLLGVGCASTNPKPDPFSYSYSGIPILFDDQKHTVIFEHAGEALRPKLVIVDGMILPGSVLHFPEIVRISLKPFSRFRDGWIKISDSTEVFDIELKGGISVANQARFFDGFFSNKPVRVIESQDYHDGIMQVDPIADAGNAVAAQARGISKWSSDLNRNGLSEIWIVLGSSMQVWEGYKGKNSLLLLDYRRL